jgi:hypothetical protein
LQFLVFDGEKRTKEQLPMWHESLQSLVVSKQSLRVDFIPMAARTNCEALVENLLSSDKR